MRALCFEGSSQAPVVTYAAAVPRPGNGELLIRVYAAGVIPTELSWYPTAHRKSGETRQGAVLGHEFSGIVTAVGEDVGSLEIGVEVFGMNDSTCVRWGIGMRRRSTVRSPSISKGRFFWRRRCCRSLRILPPHPSTRT